MSRAIIEREREYMRVNGMKGSRAKFVDRDKGPVQAWSANHEADQR